MKTSAAMASLALTLLLGGQVFGQILCIKEKTANLTSSPSLSGSLVVLEVPRHYPLQVQEENGDFWHVRDYLGRDGWVSKSVVGPENGVVIKAKIANVRSGPGTSNKIVFKARKGVTFRVLQDQSGWLQVEHESRKIGWVAKDLVWGQ